MNALNAQRYLTPPAIARRLGVSRDTVLGWIASGELRALNVAPRSSRRPRWRIAPEDLAAFELARAANAPPPATPRRRRAKTEAGVIPFY
jgi:excisionase family DNA binding protein